MTPAMDTENAKAQMRKGTLEFCILLLISRKEVYASDILQSLKDADLIVVEGTLYPLLSRLKNADLLSYEWRESKSGPPRKYYTLTKKGKDVLKELTDTWKSLNASIHSLLTPSSHA
jgi:PadR family transcriptional regulator, regulatory protein PadR